jgi:quinol-cytochrome oxidoreductase complex cytochrome b subunit
MATRPRRNPLFIVMALTALMAGPAKDARDDMPESKTHPYFPDHVWPYAILGMATLILLGLLALIGQPLLQLGQAADPRVTAVPRPEWYFLSLFQLVKLGPALITSILAPLALVLGLLLWPVLDARFGPAVARKLGWTSWPAPRRNPLTAAIWFAGLAVIGLLTLWAAIWPELCIPWFFNGPVCGG